jgi:CRISPR/Cas system-associated endoribonuclease Cas2
VLAKAIASNPQQPRNRVEVLTYRRRFRIISQDMANKLKVSYDINIADANARAAIVRILKALMDWVQISESEWLVLANRHNAATLQDRIKSFLISKESNVFVKDMKKTKIKNDGYLNAKNGEASEILFTNRF